MTNSVHVRPGASSEAQAVVAVLHEAAAFMAMKGGPAWNVEELDEAFARRFIDAGELFVAVVDGVICGVCTLSREDPLFWPGAAPGQAAYLHKLAVRRSHAGRDVSAALIGACRETARQWRLPKLRLDCHPRMRPLYERLGFTYVDRFNPYPNVIFEADRLELSA